MVKFLGGRRTVSERGGDCGCACVVCETRQYPEASAERLPRAAFVVVEISVFVFVVRILCVRRL